MSLQSFQDQLVRCGCGAEQLALLVGFLRLARQAEFAENLADLEAPGRAANDLSISVIMTIVRRVVTADHAHQSDFYQVRFAHGSWLQKGAWELNNRRLVRTRQPSDYTFRSNIRLPLAVDPCRFSQHGRQDWRFVDQVPVPIYDHYAAMTC